MRCMNLNENHFGVTSANVSISNAFAYISILKLSISITKVNVANFKSAPNKSSFCMCFSTSCKNYPDDIIGSVYIFAKFSR